MAQRKRNKRLLLKTRTTKNLTSSQDVEYMTLGNGIVELITSSNSRDKPNNSISRFKKLSKDTYLDTETGEVKEYKHYEKRIDSWKEMQKTFHELRRRINYNFIGNEAEKFITLTYAKKMTDRDKLYKDFKNFWLKLKYRFPNLEYIVIIEPQHSGSWHLHVLVRNNNNEKLFIEQDLLDTLWGHGITHIEPITDVDNLGAYFVARFTDDNLLENDNNVETKEKAIVKGARLKFYLTGFKIYRCSKGIKKVTSVDMPYGMAKHKVKGMNRTYAKTKRILSQDETKVKHVLNEITYEQFNSNRKESEVNADEENRIN